MSEDTKKEEVTYKNVVHIHDAGWPLCYRLEPHRDLWRNGPTVRQHALANCPDCLEMV